MGETIRWNVLFLVNTVRCSRYTIAGTVLEDSCKYLDFAFLTTRDLTSLVNGFGGHSS